MHQPLKRRLTNRGNLPKMEGMQEKTGRVELGKTRDENGAPSVTTTKGGEPKGENSKIKDLDEVVKSASSLKPEDY